MTAVAQAIASPSAVQVVHRQPSVGRDAKEAVARRRICRVLRLVGGLTARASTVILPPQRSVQNYPLSARCASSVRLPELRWDAAASLMQMHVPWILFFGYKHFTCCKLQPHMHFGCKHCISGPMLVCQHTTCLVEGAYL